MSHNKINDKLKFNIPNYDVDAYKETIRLAKNVDFGVKKHRMTEIQSAIAQVKFIPLKTWGLKIGIAFCLNAAILFEFKGEGTNLWIIMSIVIPLLCLVGTNEICNVLRSDLKGLLMTVRYSIKKIILIRLILFGITDFLILFLSIIGAFILKIHFGWSDLLHIIAFYNLMCVGCLYILNHTKETNAIFYCASWGGGLSIMSLIIRNIFIELIIGKENFILLFIILLSTWKALSEIKVMLGGYQNSEIMG